MRSVPLTMDGRRRYVEYRLLGDVSEPSGGNPHVFSPTGFLDDSMWHRAYWASMGGASFRRGGGGWLQTGQRVRAGRLQLGMQGDVEHATAAVCDCQFRQETEPVFRRDG